MAYSKEKLKSNGDRTSLCFSLFCTGNVTYMNFAIGFI
jgi:hypothetical protein